MIRGEIESLDLVKINNPNTMFAVFKNSTSKMAVGKKKRVKFFASPFHNPRFMNEQRKAWFMVFSMFKFCI